MTHHFLCFNMNYRIEYIIDNYISSHFKFVQASDLCQAQKLFTEMMNKQFPKAHVNILNTVIVLEQNNNIVTVEV